MNATPPSPDDRAHDEAIDWLILLAEEPDDADLRARFEAWHAVSAENRSAWDHAGRVSDLVGQSQNLVFLDSARPVAIPVVLGEPRRRRWPIFAMGAVAACLTLLAAPDMLLRLRSDYRTETAEQQSIVLKDGSTIRLGPQSAVAVDLAGGQRTVRLLSGEAYFEVARDPRRPFRIHSAEAVTTVLGTGFDVQQRADGTYVAVRHGRVRVDRNGSPSDSSLLTAGQWVTVGKGRTRGEGAASLVGSWSGGKLAVVDRPVGDVIADIRRYYRGIIIVNDDALAARSVSGSFDMADPMAAVTALVRPHGATVRQITPWIILISPS